MSRWIKHGCERGRENISGAAKLLEKRWGRLWVSTGNSQADDLCTGAANREEDVSRLVGFAQEANIFT